MSIGTALGLPEAIWFGSDGLALDFGLGMIARSGLGGRHVADQFAQPKVVDGLDAPTPAEAGILGLEDISATKPYDRTRSGYGLFPRNLRRPHGIIGRLSCLYRCGVR